jgi:hypothetical protein
MKPPTESPPNAQQKANAAPGASTQKPVVEPPTQPFIIVDGDGPGDPSKFQRFILPKEFIEKANAVELPRLNPDDFVDTDPPAQAQAVPDGPDHADLAVNKADSAGGALASQETVVISKRRKSAPIPKELLSGATPLESKSILRNKLMWALGGVLIFLILLLSHLKGGNDSAVASSIPTASMSTPLVQTSATKPTAASAPATTEPQVAHSIDTPSHTGVAPPSASSRKNPSEGLRTSHPNAGESKSPTKAPPPTQTATPTAVSSAAVGKTPWFIQDN